MLYEYRLIFNAPVHLGVEGIGQERIEERGRSDTLWGAIIQQWLYLFSDEPEELCLNTPFSISSCFPFINDIPFYPVPLGSFDHLLEKSLNQTKQSLDFKYLKKVRFICKDLFLALIKGKRLSTEDITEDNVHPFPENSESAANLCQPFFKIIQRPRLRVDQLSEGSEEGAFFYCSDQYFNSKPKNGLFFLASFRDSETKNRFEAALQLLGDSGLGADRSVGRGTFTFSVRENNELKAHTLPGSIIPSHLLLSLYHPTRSEVNQGILQGDASYTLIQRSGHAASPAMSRYRRADLWMLEEGSVVETKPEGNVICVLERSDKMLHNVYRCGRAFSIPVTLPA